MRPYIYIHLCICVSVALHLSLYLYPYFQIDLTIGKDLCKLKLIQLGEPKTTRELKTLAYEELDLFSLERIYLRAS